MFKKIGNIIDTCSNIFASKEELETKQDTLVSGTNIKTINNNSLLGSGDITIQGGGGGTGVLPQFTYTDLQNIIDDANDGDTIYLNGYFKYNSSDDITAFIEIDKDLTIIGEGCTIDGNGKRGFDIYQGITIKNLNFVNCSTDYEDGGAIWYYGDNGSVSNCSFINCNANNGGAIYFNNSAHDSVSNCSFTNCNANNGGAIYWSTGTNDSVSNCSFTNCNASDRNGGAIYWDVSFYDSASNCSFTNCNASVCGGAIYSDYGSDNSVSNCNFVNCSTDDTDDTDDDGGAIYFKNSSGSVVDCIFKTETDTVEGVIPTYTPLDQLKDGERPTAKAVYDYHESHQSLTNYYTKTEVEDLINTTVHSILQSIFDNKIGDIRYSNGRIIAQLYENDDL